jgi:DNA-binding transcriptional ArsR family regulator
MERALALLQVLGDEVADAIVHELLEDDNTQAGLVRRTGYAQSRISRTLERLEACGIVLRTDRRNARLSLVHRDRVSELLRITNVLAEDVLSAELAEQRARSQRTKRAAERPPRAARSPETST